MEEMITEKAIQHAYRSIKKVKFTSTYLRWNNVYRASLNRWLALAGTFSHEAYEMVNEIVQWIGFLETNKLPEMDEMRIKGLYVAKDFEKWTANTINFLEVLANKEDDRFQSIMANELLERHKEWNKTHELPDNYDDEDEDDSVM